MRSFEFGLFKQCLVVIVASFFLGGCAAKLSFKKAPSTSPHLNLAVVDVRDEYLPYKEFCLRNLGECSMVGPSVVEFSTQVESLLAMVNIAVNHEVEFVLDIDEYQSEEFWTYPRMGRGDCEDIALEKRARLTQSGMPRGAMMIAIVHDRKKLSSHGVLLVETTSGTYVLDSNVDTIRYWHQFPYNYESRERPDGKWERFDQSVWEFD